MADDKTAEAIKGLLSMFPDIDQETITDIFLGCKKDADRAIDQLLNMGAVMDTAASKKQSAQIPVNNNNTPASPVLTSPPLSVDKAPSSPVISTTHVTDSNPERERLEMLNQQLSQEYRRLAETQERNMVLEKQLAATQASIASEYQVLAEERRRLEEQQAAFQADKKRLEEHLSGRLREMKEEMRKREEQAREAEDKRRLETESFYRGAEEERRVLNEEKAKRSEDKAARKEEKARAVERVERQIKAMEEESKMLQAVIAQMDQEKLALSETVGRLEEEAVTREEAWRSENEALHKQVMVLEESSVGSEQSAQESVVGALQTVSHWLTKGLEDFQRKSVTPAELKQELLKSLQTTTLG